MDNLIIKNLSKQLGDFQLKDITLSVPTGCILGLVGENGAGKTTLIKLILGLLTKDTGEILIFNKEQEKYEKEIKENLGIVLDECIFHDGLTCLDINKIMKNIYSKWDEACYKSYISRFQLPEKKKIKSYSKGMKMQLCLAVAMSHHARLLLLDEAMSGLDPVVRREILDVFREYIMDEEKSILISSHITSDLEKICDYIAFIHKGRLLMMESKDELLENYGIMKCGSRDFLSVAKEDIVSYQKNSFGYEILVKEKRRIAKKYKDFIIDPTNLEEIMVFMIRRDTI